MRKSIFDVAKESLSIETEAKRIIRLYKDEALVIANNQESSLYEFCSWYCFESWGGRGHFLDMDDFTNSINIEFIEKMALSGNEDFFIILLEYVFNLVHMAVCYCRYDNSISAVGNMFELLQTILKDDIDSLNYKYEVINDLVYIIEKKPMARINYSFIHLSFYYVLLFKH